jgi:F-type H+-transporting ATPase subunit b
VRSALKAAPNASALQGPAAPHGPASPHPPGWPPGHAPPGLPGQHDAAHAGAPHQESHEGAEHGHHDPKAPPEAINWWHGVLGEKEGAKPGFLWRAPGEPPPFVATVFNFALLVYAFVYFGRKPLREALAKRKEDITREMQEAQRIREEAEKRVQQYEERFGRLAEELDRIRRELREQGERDRDRIIREAEERAAKLRADAAYLLDQELSEIRRTLLAETVDHAVRLASELIGQHGTPSDHDRFAEVFLAQLKARPGHGAHRAGHDALVKGGSS